MVLLLPKKEKEKLVIQLAKEGKTTRDIAKRLHISLKDIGEIIRKETGDEDPKKSQRESANNQMKIEKIKRSSLYAQAFQMFREKKTLAEVVVELDLKAEIVVDYYSDYLNLTNMKRLVRIYNEIGDDLAFFLYFYGRVKKEDLDDTSTLEVLLRRVKSLSSLDKELQVYLAQKERLLTELTNLKREIEKFKHVRDNYDGSPIVI